VVRSDVLSEDEVDGMIRRADKLFESEYFKLRAKALISLFYLTGKRVSEVASVRSEDVQIKGDYLSVTFTVVKKRRQNILSTRREKLLPLASKYTQHILNYLNHLKEICPESQYLFPSVRSVFGYTTIQPNKHLSRKSIWWTVKALNPNAWCHLFRETMGAKIVRSDPSIIAPFKVMRRLDLESHTTAFRYMQRYTAEVIEESEGT
jgi:integrase